MLYAIDITESNVVYIEEILNDGAGDYLHRRPVDSRYDVSAEDDVIQDIVSNLPYRADLGHSDGVNNSIGSIRVHVPSATMYVKRSAHVMENGRYKRTHKLEHKCCDPLHEDTDEKVMAVKSVIHTPDVIASAARNKADRLKEISDFSEHEVKSAAYLVKKARIEHLQDKEDEFLKSLYDQAVAQEVTAKGRRDQAKANAEEAEVVAINAENNVPRET
jgi:hypothetical protein